MRRTAPILLLFLLAALLRVAPAAAAAKVIKLASIVPAGSVWDKELQAMAADVSKKTQGRVSLRIFPGMVSGDDPDVVRKMRIGQLQAAMLTIDGLSELDKGFTVFSVPRFFDSYEELYAVMEKLTPALSARLDKQGFVLLGWGQGGWVNLFSKTPVYTPSDVKKLKLFVWAGDNKMTDWWKSNGYNPVPLPATEVMMSLQTGMLQALPTVPLGALTLQWYKPLPYMLDLGLAPMIGGTVISKKVWNTLTPEDQAVLRELAKKMERSQQQGIPGQDRRAIDEMVKRGLKVTKPQNAQQIKEWEEAAAQFGASMRQKVVPPEIYDEAKKARDAFRATRP